MREGRLLGERYRLVDVLGFGGMSEVWRAHDEVLGRSVAVKLLSGRHATDAASRQRIRDEARAAAKLSHPNIAQVYDFGETLENGTRLPYVVMELVPGVTLEDRAAAGALPPRLALRICAEVAAGLAAAHADGLVHRDIKPANVILGPVGAKVVDFGIAAAVGAAAGDRNGELLGTPAYVAPERITDDAVVPASDVYSLGVLLFKLLTGHLPWRAETAVEMLEANLYDPPPRLPEQSGVAPEVDRLCQRCLAKEPATRPSAEEVATTLAEAAGVRAVTNVADHAQAPPAADGGPSTVLVRPARTGSTSRRRRRIAVALAALTATAAGILAGLFVGPPDRQVPLDARSRPSTTPTSLTATSPAPASPVPGAGGGATPPPVRPSSQPAAPTTTAPPAATTARTFTSPGGTVVASCVQPELAQLLAWTPTLPAKVEQVVPGPATAATVTFKHGKQLIQMTVTCTAGTPSVVTTDGK